MTNTQTALNIINSLFLLWIAIGVFNFTTDNKELLKLMVTKTKLEIQILNRDLGRCQITQNH